MSMSTFIISVQKLDIDLHHVYIVHDELDKHVGKFAMKEGGSAGYVRNVHSFVGLCCVVIIKPLV